MVSSIAQVTGLFVWLLVGLFFISRIGAYLLRLQSVPIRDRWIVITGCDSGIGSLVMRRLIAEGAAIIACCYTEEGAQAALAAGARLAPQLDLTNEKALHEAVDQVREACGGQLWGLVHNAGAARPGFIEFQRLENYRRIMDVNFFAVVNLTERLIPSLKAAGGRVVIVSSVDGIVSLPGNAPYDASKFAIEAYADALRVELSFWGVAVSVINPSTLKTPLALRFFESEIDTWEQMDQAEPTGAWKQAWPREWLDAYVAENSSRLARIAQDPICAVDDITHALAARRPRFRYLSGNLAKTLFHALWKMPERWSFALKKGLVNPPPRITD